MERLKNFISDHKVEVGLAIFGSSLAIFWFLQRKHPISSILVVPNYPRLEYSKDFLQNLKRTPLGSEEESRIINSIKVCEKYNVNKLTSQLPEKTYINVQYLMDLLEKSKVGIVYDVLYSKSTFSTQTISYKHFEDFNNPLIYIADTQTHGRGRKDNRWESQQGSLLVTFTSIIKVEGLVVMQYLVSLAIHEAILEITGEKFILKWPNDTYYANEKIAGSLIQASDLIDNSVYKKIFVGIGVNVDNNEPTTCINQILKNRGKAHITAEQLLVKILEKFQENLEILETSGWENGLDKRYFNYWEDFGIEAELVKEAEEVREKVKINGIDTIGNLVLIDSTEKAIKINPNFYSYDPIHKVFYPK